MLPIAFIRLLRKLKILSKINIHKRISLNGKSFLIPITREIGIHNLMMDEFWMLDLFNQFLVHKEDILIDIGANVGQTALKWKSVNDFAPVICIEPQKSCSEYLHTLKSINQFQHFDIINAALDLHNGSTTLHYHFDEPTDRTASLKSIEFKPTHTDQVAAMKFSSILKKCAIDPSKIKIIKIDVEGYEKNILESMRDFLNQYRTIIIVEILSQNQDYAASISTSIQMMGYHIFRIKKHNFHLDNLEKINCITHPTDIEDSDYLLLPIEKQHVESRTTQ